MNLVIKVWFALEAGKQLSEDRKQGALELLLSTPLTVQDILRGQRLALERQFLGPVMVVLMVLFLVKGSAIRALVHQKITLPSGLFFQTVLPQLF